MFVDDAKCYYIHMYMYIDCMHACRFLYKLTGRKVTGDEKNICKPFKSLIEPKSEPLIYY